MASADDANSLEDDPEEPPRPLTVYTFQSPSLYPVLKSPESPPQLNMFSYSSKDFAPQAARAKRRQVKNACVHCQKACKKCDDARPCLRCVKYGVAEECVDSPRKERKKGVKRGPYKKRDGKGSSVDPYDGSSNDASVQSNNNKRMGSPSPPVYFPIGYPSPVYYPQQPQALESTSEPPVLYSSPQQILPHIHAQPDSTLPDSYHPQPYYQAAPIYPLLHQPHYIMAPAQQQQHNYPVLVGATFPKHNSFEYQPEMVHQQG
ncbi:hypothetical protein FA15DRAFT_668883 [Coprinopsis marcescibilis]|uniref:Transcription activator of gluconeogenesis ERT1 n=1 Tax=Coprinopsis marcescibilis TaxID=230819 RepID=A0A5C3KYV6_COPMA|nr:hypothetical protein FA15DRAFT_668883 [Coprinopsis marcescibilis]